MSLVSFSYDKPLSSGHLMNTQGSLLNDGNLRATTRTRSVVKLGGFHGAVCAKLYDAQDRLIAQGGVHTYGVDGVWVGQSDRTDAWTENFGPGIGAAATKVSITHSWDPQWLDGIGKTVVVVGQILSAVLAALGSGGFTGVFAHSIMNELIPNPHEQEDPIGELLAVEGDGLDIDAPLVV